MNDPKEVDLLEWCGRSDKQGPPRSNQKVSTQYIQNDAVTSMARLRNYSGESRRLQSDI